MLVEDAGIKGIKGVPCTVINNTWVIQGAQNADTFFAVRNSSLTHAMMLTTPVLAPSFSLFPFLPFLPDAMSRSF
jgi:hypothetical protein